VGIIIPASIRGHILLHQLKQAQREEWGRDFRSCMQNLRKSYPYTHMHDNASIAAILAEVAGADAVQNLSKAPTSLPEQANAVNSLVSSILRSAAEYKTDDDTVTEQASAVASNSESSAETRCSRRRTNTKSRNTRGSSRGGCNNRSRSRGGWRERRDSDDLQCKHCKKANREPTHFGIPEDECFFNQKHKEWKPELVCEKLDIEYVAKSKFRKE
jgi:hypothetical protein